MYDRHAKFKAIVDFRNLLEKQMGKINPMRRSIKTTKEVMLLLDAILDNFDSFDVLGDNVNVYYQTENEESSKSKITKMKIEA